MLSGCTVCSRERGIKIWIDGGWAVDALLVEQTRSHADLDIALETRFLGRLRDVLAERGYQQVPRDDKRPWNFVLGNGAGLEVDVHAFTFDENGDGVYGPPENGDYYMADALTGEGAIEGRPGEMYLARMARPIPHSDRSAAGLQSVKVTRCLTCGVELIRMLSDWGRDDHWASELATANRGIEERISRVSGQERDNVATQ
jgi:hypothetical protein